MTPVIPFSRGRSSSNRTLCLWVVRTFFLSCSSLQSFLLSSIRYVAWHIGHIARRFSGFASALLSMRLTSYTFSVWPLFETVSSLPQLGQNIPSPSATGAAVCAGWAGVCGLFFSSAARFCCFCFSSSSCWTRPAVVWIISTIHAATFSPTLAASIVAS